MSNNELTKIPSTFLQESRIETGPIQFGDDWPGVFIRGDNAMHYGFSLQTFLDSNRSTQMGWVEKAILESLVKILMSCDIRE